jgi:hypothetical protein
VGSHKSTVALPESFQTILSALKVLYHEMVCQMRRLMYSLGLNIAPGICFTLVKLHVRNKQRLKQAVSGCKMAGAGFYSIAKLCAHILTLSWLIAV